MNESIMFDKNYFLFEADGVIEPATGLPRVTPLEIIFRCERYVNDFGFDSNTNHTNFVRVIEAIYLKSQTTTHENFIIHSFMPITPNKHDKEYFNSLGNEHIIIINGARYKLTIHYVHCEENGLCSSTHIITTFKKIETEISSTLRHMF